MQFLQHVPQMALCGAGDATTFFAELYDTRPGFKDILKYGAIMEAHRTHIVSLLQRRNNQLASMNLIVDSKGICGLFIFCTPLGTGNAKSAISALIRKFDPLIQDNVMRSLRPFDELDSFRVVAMKTITSLRPEDNKYQDSIPVPQAPAGCERWQLRVEEYEAALALRDEFPIVSSLPQTLSISDVYMAPLTAESCAVFNENEVWSDAGGSDSSDDSVDESEDQLAKQRRECWIEAAQREAAVSILSIGAGSSRISYIYCVHEDRRRLLMCQGLIKPWLPELVERGLELVENGSLPQARSPQQKCMFRKRCIAVRKQLSPDVALTQYELRDMEILMGNAPPCDMCATAKTAHCYEWDHAYRRWTRHGVLKRDQLFMADHPSSEPKFERKMCNACSLVHNVSCTDCRSSTNFLPGYNPYHILPTPRECKCGGFASENAGRYKGPNLRTRMQLFLEEMHVRLEHECEEGGEELEEPELRASVKRSYDNLAEAVERLTL
jgi:hypothetical protein